MADRKKVLYYFVKYKEVIMIKQSSNVSLMTLGWREWLTLPEFGVNCIEAKIDTGARTSALHAFSVDIVNGNPNRLCFQMHSIQKNDQVIVACEADILDQRLITNSGGYKELRYVIKTDIILGSRRWPIEITLTNRASMGFRMLLGRSALKNIIINPNRSFIASHKDPFSENCDFIN